MMQDPPDRIDNTHLDATSLALVTAIARLGMRPSRRHVDDARVDEATSPREGKGRESRGMVRAFSVVRRFLSFFISEN